jgi:hypothetical protein
MSVLLKYEKDAAGMHSSATVGFLWLGRSINY